MSASSNEQTALDKVQMKSSLPTFLSRLVMSLAMLMLFIGGGTFNHSLTGHEKHSHEHSGAADHHHADQDQGDFDFSGKETVHCGAYLLALTCDVETQAPALADALIADEPQLFLSKSGAVEPPPPRQPSLS